MFHALAFKGFSSKNNSYQQGNDPKNVSGRKLIRRNRENQFLKQCN